MRIKSFEYLIFSREGKVILGNRWKNAIVVLIILLATFFSLGLSKGSTEYLKNKMDDPFNTWISFDKNMSIESLELNKLMDSLSSDNIKNKYNIDTSKTHLGDYIKSPVFINKLINANKKNVWHITLDQKDTLFRYIAKEMLVLNNNMSIDSLVDNFDKSHGIIIKESLLKQLGIKELPSSEFFYLKYQIKMERVNTKKTNIYVSIPILGTVKNLPLGVDFICSRNTYNYINQPLYNKNTNSSCNYMTENLDTNLILQIFISDAIKIDEVKSKINLNLDELPKEDFWESSYVSGRYYKILSKVNLDDLNSLINDNFPYEVHIVESFDKIKSHRNCKETNLFGKFYKAEPSYVTLQLNNLKKISELKIYLDNFPKTNNFKNKSKGLINIDVSAVKSRKNLLFISELTKVLSIFLLIFSMFSILIFLVNIINTHFEKIKQNIGTLKAFGLSNNKLITNYILIYSLIIFVTAVIAFVSSVILGQLGFSVLIFNLLDITIEDGEKCFELLNLSGFLSFFFIITLSISVVYFRLRKILLSTPGDLIFER